MDEGLEYNRILCCSGFQTVGRDSWWVAEVLQGGAREDVKHLEMTLFLKCAI